MTPPATMRALTMTGFGGLERLAVLEVPHPGPPGPGEALVRVRTASVNHIDLFVLQGLPKAEYRFPHIMGSDGAGVVEAVGEGVTDLAPGDRVLLNPGISCGTCSVCLAGEQPLCRGYRILGEHLEGTAAEYIRVPARNAARFGDAFNWPEAAAFPLATLTAWRMLVSRAALQSGESVLIWGIGGGVAQAALRIARRIGARTMVTSSSEDKLEAARAMGADHGFHHGSDDVVRRVRELTGVGCDVVVDCVGESTWDRSLRCLRPMGRLVTCGATSGPQVGLDLRRLFWFQWSLLGSTMGNDAEFAEIVRLARSGELRPVVDSIIPLDRAPLALARMDAGAQFGKLVIEVAHE